MIEAEPSDNFLETLNEFLSQNVYFKTYQEAMKLTNVLDLFITESKERVYELEPGHVLGGKDNRHLCLTWKYSLKHASSVGSFGFNMFKKSKSNLKKGNHDGMRSFFDSINWSEIFDKKNVGDCYKKFLEIYENACVQFIPKINIDKKRK